jgi:D-aminoacyl-tRNA deacylase
LSCEEKSTIVCSTQDMASQNIKNCLLALGKWEAVESDGFSVFEWKGFRIVEIKEALVYQDGLDKRLVECALPARLIIFASRHKSKDGRAIMTVHSTGNINEAKHGGYPKMLAAAAPQAVRSLLCSLSILAEKEKENKCYDVTLECTHHGPCDIDVPSVFIEIGSGQEQWEDEVAGRIIADAILMLKENESPVAVGFGGTHYVPRQTALILETGITFGHIFPSYALPELNEDIIKQAFTKSGADFAYLDRKAMKAQQREELKAIVERIGFEVRKERDIRETEKL